MKTLQFLSLVLATFALSAEDQFLKDLEKAEGRISRADDVLKFVERFVNPKNQHQIFVRTIGCDKERCYLYKEWRTIVKNLATKHEEERIDHTESPRVFTAEYSKEIRAILGKKWVAAVRQFKQDKSIQK